MKKILLALGITLIATIGFSGLVVDFSPEKLSAVWSPVTTSIDTATTRTWAFSDTSVFFNGPTADGAKVYGGSRHSNNTAFNTTADRLDMESGLDVFRSLVGASTGQVATDTTILLWNKADFLSDSTSQLKFDNTAGSLLSVTTDKVLKNTWDAHFVIKNAGEYYISDASVAGANASNTTSINGAESVLWAEFDPSSFDLSATSAYASRSFNDVEAVGFVYASSRNDIQTRTYVTDFTANLVAVPEPATIGMLGLGGLIVLSVRRRLTW